MYEALGAKGPRANRIWGRIGGGVGQPSPNRNVMNGSEKREKMIDEIMFVKLISTSLVLTEVGLTQIKQHFNLQPALFFLP